VSKALIVVDMQNDFITGTLAVPNAQEIVGPIQEIMYRNWLNDFQVVLTRDNHPKTHISFNVNGGKWPMHCVHNTWGAELQVGIRAMTTEMNLQVFRKGEKAEIEEYSGFANPKLHEHLQKCNIKEVEICGLARNVCVEDTAEAARKLGYKVTISEKLCRSVAMK
jgi:nicotinamidase/pyrazinamidase